ncbi:MAG: hypothetical protein QME81_00810 [bacterium]|nr:hypothetical protein [bacterium]
MKLLSVIITGAVTFLVVLTPLCAQAQSSQEINRQILEKLTQVETRLIQVETRLIQIETRLTRVETRLTRVETKVEEGQKALNQRMDDLRSELKGNITDLRDLVYVLLVGIFTLVGFILWDRRSTIAPVVKQARELEDNKDAVWKVLKEYAKREPRFAEVLRTAGILYSS